MPFRAKLDSNGVYQGVEEVMEIGPGDCGVPADCDLAIGRYRWDGARFEPVVDPNPVSDQPAPAALTAIAVFLVTQYNKGVSLPRTTLLWLDSYITSIDVRDTAPILDPINGVKDYLEKRGLIQPGAL